MNRDSVPADRHRPSLTQASQHADQRIMIRVNHVDVSHLGSLAASESLESESRAFTGKPLFARPPVVEASESGGCQPWNCAYTHVHWYWAAASLSGVVLQRQSTGTQAAPEPGPRAQSPRSALPSHVTDVIHPSHF